MDSDFWHKKWEDNQIGFHRASVNPLLVRFLSVLGLAPGARVFLPLCGKTRDIAWLRDQGFRVAGAELSRMAIEQLFDELGETPEITEHGTLTRFSGKRIDIFVGDIFELSAPVLGPVDAIYDRAALVALPHDMRPRYGAHLAGITGTAPQLLLCFEHSVGEEKGPPFSVDRAEVARVHGESYTADLLLDEEIDGELKGDNAAHDVVWHLLPKV
ncbi:thiopurine S-methyltransferase [Pseudooceanicola atlanticus]|uniref:Thiopurine S-methyltransferase n=1 Tax=Pseudooceanicola atlanticus TaxID=1461694 RepID=A0A0A0EID2_9RHOB|nr:thiopurine S-methyltransferase [Pseudooceanicola atlanticus]KGM50174.1 thiopurine S-methyltransferase [Pseudooceanicola atlanticus]